MSTKEFYALRQELQKTQKQMAQLLGASLRAVQSFEQGWRKIPVYVERQMLFLHAMKRRVEKKIRPCWEIRRCSLTSRQACSAWEFRVGHLCWFINGTICQGKSQESWTQKMKLCRECPVFATMMKF